jgi:hypothetical protein
MTVIVAAGSAFGVCAATPAAVKATAANVIDAMLIFICDLPSASNDVKPRGDAIELPRTNSTASIASSPKARRKKAALSPDFATHS